MKIVCFNATPSFDVVVAYGIDELWLGRTMTDALNRDRGGRNSSERYALVDNSYVLGSPLERIL